MTTILRDDEGNCDYILEHVWRIQWISSDQEMFDRGVPVSGAILTFNNGSTIELTALRR